jgi:hypothetical protein
LEHKKELMETIRNIRRWMFDFDYLTLNVGDSVLDNTDGRRYLYELTEQDVEVVFHMKGNIIVIN